MHFRRKKLTRPEKQQQHKSLIAELRGRGRNSCSHNPVSHTPRRLRLDLARRPWREPGEPGGEAASSADGWAA